LIWKVTIASAIQIMAKTPLKTSERWSSRALIERRKDRRRQKSSGPLEYRVSKHVPYYVFQHLESIPHIPKVPVPQSLAHSSLKNSIRVRPPAYNAAQLSHSRNPTSQTISLTSFRTSHAAALIQHAAQQILGPKDLAHLLPNG
jgi:hypothetical protein